MVRGGRLAAAGAGLLIAGVVLVVFVAGYFATASAGFLAGYSGLRPRYETWLESKHRSVPCEACHASGQSAARYRISLIADYYRSVLSKKKGVRPETARLERPTRAACMACHEGDTTAEAKRLLRIPHPAHVRVAQEKRDCVTCHKWTTHVERYEEKHKKIPFTGICMSYGCHSGTKASSECRSCHHSQSYASGKWRKTHPEVAFNKGEASCLDYCHESKQCRTCHQTGKSPDITGSRVASSVRSIVQLHSEPQWLSRHGRKAREDTSRCFYCHGSDAECRDCHSRRPAFHGAKDEWLGRHQKLGKGKKEQRCLACHKRKECNDCHAIFKEGR